jgi:DNA-binding MarR family transcriptional regulator
MVGRGLVRRHVDERDRRRVLVQTTARGRAQHERLRTIAARRSDAVLAAARRHGSSASRCSLPSCRSERRRDRRAGTAGHPKR